MKFPVRHNWQVTTAEARALQTQLSQEVIREDQLGTVNVVAGVDVGFEDEGQTTRAAVAVLSFPELKLIDQQVVRRPTLMPYIPGYLSFREVPALIEALELLTSLPDLILCDGQGIAHPRRLGLAC
ncbi:MAG: endonuclease V, partial [Anaerolineales bacterium]|nr:endonuclease V [Anaerolineales bacterium]